MRPVATDVARFVVCESMWWVHRWPLQNGWTDRDVVSGQTPASPRNHVLYTYRGVHNTSAPPGKYDWMIRTRRRCGLASQCSDRCLELSFVVGRIVFETLVYFQNSYCRLSKVFTLGSVILRRFGPHSFHNSISSCLFYSLRRPVCNNNVRNM